MSSYVYARPARRLSRKPVRRQSTQSRCTHTRAPANAVSHTFPVTQNFATHHPCIASFTLTDMSIHSLTTPLICAPPPPVLNPLPFSHVVITAVVVETSSAALTPPMLFLLIKKLASTPRALFSVRATLATPTTAHGVRAELLALAASPAEVARRLPLYPLVSPSTRTARPSQTSKTLPEASPRASVILNGAPFRLASPFDLP